MSSFLNGDGKKCLNAAACSSASQVFVGTDSGKTLLYFIEKCYLATWIQGVSVTARPILKACLICACLLGANSSPFVMGALAQSAGQDRADVISIKTMSDLSLDQVQETDLLPAAASREGLGGARISVSRAADLVGTASRAVREDYGEESIASSYSDRPVVRVQILGGAGLTSAPLDRMRLTSRFGSRRHPIDGVSRLHGGVDYGAAHGTQIMATGDAIVTHAGNAGGYGLLVKLDHGSGLETRYAHMSRIAVSVGDRVSAGQVIGYVGSTGRSTGAHLHYETRVDGRAVDPLTR